MRTVLPFIAILAAGLLTAAEGATNGWGGRTAGSLYLAMIAVFALSALLLPAAAPFVPVRANWREVRALRWYAWAGGLYTVVTISLAPWATPKLGAGPALVGALLAQTAFGLVLDNYAPLGLERHPVTWLKVGGQAVMLVGAVMVAVKE